MHEHLKTLIACYFRKTVMYKHFTNLISKNNDLNSLCFNVKMKHLFSFSYNMFIKHFSVNNLF